MNTALESGSEISDPYSIPETPDWLNSNDATGPLDSELGSVDKYYNINRYLKHMNQAASAQFGMDLAEGQNAADEATSRSLQNGTQGSVNTSMIAAQTALPGMQAVLNTKAKTAEMALDAGMRNQQARADIAKSIASARSSYASTLASYITTLRGQNISGFNMGESNKIASTNAETNQKSLYATLLANPNTSPEVKEYAKRMLGITGGAEGTPNLGYITNAGPIRDNSSTSSPLPFYSSNS